MRKKMFSLLASIISLVLSFSVLLNTGAAAYDSSVNVNSSENDYSENEVEDFSSALFGFVNSVFSYGHSQPNAKGDKVDIRFPFIIVPLKDSAGFFASIKTWLWIGTELTVLDYSGDYTHVKTNDSVNGYIFSMFLEDDDEGFLSVKNFEHVYEDSSKEITFNYSGSKRIKWSVSQDKNYIECKETENGIKIKGLNPGTAKITVTAGSQTKELYVHCIYKWKKNWTGKAGTATEIRTGPGEEYKSRASLPNGSKFYVRGDEGGSDGWAYGYGTVNGTDYWGFVRIEDISTKNTVSYYNNLGWVWPLQNTSIKHISSTYGPRTVTTGSSNHRGMDITTGIKDEIKGEPIIAPFDGIVKLSGYETSCGNYICITSKNVDPVTGYKIISIYMHMNSSALFGPQKEVRKGDIVGYVGTTGASSGYHLHMEANNRNAGIGDNGRSDYTYTINPLYFYMNVTPTFSNNTSYQNHGGYWYNEDAN